jgi:hypothetical protein
MAHGNVTNCQRGYSILEVIIAALITGVLTTASISFYTKIHEQSETQYNVSEMQQLCRTSLYDIRKTLLQAGFKISGQEPYVIAGDTLRVYYNGIQPIDTIQYFLVEFTPAEYADVPDLPSGNQLYKLVKKTNSDSATVFADFVTDINYNQLDSANMVVTISVQALRSDESYAPNDGFRIYSISERIKLRNVL